MSVPWRGEGFTREGARVTIQVPSRERFRDLVAECERAILLNALREFSWNKSSVTRALRIPRQSLYNKMAKFVLEEPPDGEATVDPGDEEG